MTIVKIIRDRTEPDEGSCRPVNSREGKQALLLLKLHEEAEEIAQAPSDVYEYADLIEVAVELARMNGVDEISIEAARLDKMERRGGFRAGTVWTYDGDYTDLKRES